jgi:hypothetical protein
MDVSTSLVQAYLHINGYFTATDYPLVESRRDSPPRMLTDIDMLAIRFAHPPHKRQGHELQDGRQRVSGPVTYDTDPVLKSPPDRTDMIVAEVKQGLARVNPASRNRHALAAALARFGCCDAATASKVVRRLLQSGETISSAGHVVRMVLFASRGERAPHGWHWVHLDHVMTYLNRYLQTHGDILKHVDLHDPALSWLSLLNKCELTLGHRRAKN